jgi:hypothetical protein
VFTARYALSPYIKQIRFVFKGLMLFRETSLFVVRTVRSVGAICDDAVGFLMIKHAVHEITSAHCVVKVAVKVTVFFPPESGETQRT